MKLLPIILGLFITGTASAQTILTNASYPTSVASRTDTVKTIGISSIPAQATGAGKVWDFSKIVTNNTSYEHHTAVPSGVFSSVAQYADTTIDSMGFTYYFNELQMCGIDDSGLETYGLHTDQQTIWLSATSLGGPPTTDSFTLFTQDAFYTHSHNKLSFPTTYGKSWTDSFSIILHGTLSVSAFGYVKKPADFVLSYVVNDTVTGWGTLKLKNSAGNAANVPVVQIKSKAILYQSTIVDGAEIDESQHDYTQLARLDFAFSNQYQYYTADEVTPVVRVSYSDNFVTPMAGEILSKNYAPATEVNMIPASALSLYPNPVYDRTVHVDIAGNINTTTYIITNTLGQIICSGQIEANAAHSVIIFPPETDPGIYYLSITDMGQQMIHKAMEVK